MIKREKPKPAINPEIESMVNVIRASLAYKEYPKKILAKKLKIQKSLLSLYLHNEQEMPIELLVKTFEILLLNKADRDNVLLSISL